MAFFLNIFLRTTQLGQPKSLCEVNLSMEPDAVPPAPLGPWNLQPERDVFAGQPSACLV
jgi:hypothetical protein